MPAAALTQFSGGAVAGRVHSMGNRGNGLIKNELRVKISLSNLWQRLSIIGTISSYILLEFI